MSDEYIRKVDAVDAVPKERIVEYMDEFGAGYNSCRNDMLRSIESLTPADVVPVVRCKDCKYVYCHIYHGWQEPIYTCTHLRSRWNSNNDLDVNPDNFCSYGERKED